MGYPIEKDGEQVDEINYEAGKTGVVEFKNNAASTEFSVEATKSFNGTWPAEGFDITIDGVSIEEYGNVTSTAIITVPKGCCFTVSVRYIDATTTDPAVTPTPVIEVINSNLTIERIA